MAIQDGFNW